MITGRRIVSLTNAYTDYISVAEAKAHLRVTHSSDDSYILTLITAAMEAASYYVGFSIPEAVVRYGFDSLVGQPALMNPLNGAPLTIGNYLRIASRVIDIEKMYYVNQNNAITEFSATDWIDSPDLLSDFGINIFINNLPPTLTDDNTKYIVEVTEGFSTADFPDTMKIACMLMIAQYYDNRQNIIVGTISSDMPFGANHLLDKFKISVFG
jgi:hypothetical protein